MGLIKHRPVLVLKAPRVLHPGESFVATLLVRAKRELSIRGIDVWFEGTERSRIVTGSGNSATVHRASNEIVRSSARVAKRIKLRVGERAFRIRFQVPSGAVPSFKGTSAKVEYLVRAQVDVPWWPDAKGEWILNVQPEAASYRGASTVVSTRPEGPLGKEPHLELGLVSSVVRSGGHLLGSAAISNVQFNRYHSLELRLRAAERVCVGRRTSVAYPYDFRFSLPLKDLSEAQALPFRLSVPRVPATYQGKLTSLAWQLEARAKIRLKADPSVHVAITLLTEKARISDTLAPPAVGNDRIQQAWRYVASVVGMQFNSAGVMTARVGSVDVEVAQSIGAGGVKLIGQLAFPKLGIALDGGRRSGFHRLGHALGTAAGFAPDINLGSERWAKHHYLSGRDLAQVRPFAKALGLLLPALDLEDASDGRMIFQARDPGYDPHALQRFCERLLAVAQALPQARAAIPAPASMQPYLASWAKLARTLEAKLNLGDVSVEGTLDQVPVAVASIWAGEPEPVITRLSAAFEKEFPDRLCFSAASVQALPRLAPRAAELATTLLRKNRRLSATTRAVELELLGPVRQAGRLRAELEALIDLSRALTRRRSPYR